VEAAVKSRRLRRARGSLTREQVVESALKIADTEGLPALTMPALARRLDCGVMTLYGYVDSKDDLLDAIAQHGLLDLRLPRPLPTDPIRLLLSWGRALREDLLDHPSLPALFLSHPVVGPGVLRGIEALLEPLHEGGMAPGDGVHAIYAVLTYTVGFVAWEIPRTRAQSPMQYASAWRREFASLPLAQLPVLNEAFDELPLVAGNEQFELGLLALTSGLCGATSPPATPRGQGNSGA
jgi:AcrR family transcriptional regulator